MLTFVRIHEDRVGQGAGRTNVRVALSLGRVTAEIETVTAGKR